MSNLWQFVIKYKKIEPSKFYGFIWSPSFSNTVPQHVQVHSDSVCVWVYVCVYMYVCVPTCVRVCVCVCGGMQITIEW